jgi:hypothetical protein
MNNEEAVASSDADLACRLKGMQFSIDRVQRL